MPSNEEALKEMPNEYVMCRMLRHNWNFIGFYDASGPNGRKFVAMSLECSLCGMTRDDFLDTHGNLDARHYGPPQDYNVKRGKDERREGRIHVADSRAEMISRSTIYKSSSSMARAARRK